jgi:signal peptidase I
MAQRIDAKSTITTLVDGDLLLVEKLSNTTDYHCTPVIIRNFIGAGITMTGTLTCDGQTFNCNQVAIDGGTIGGVTLGITGGAITNCQVDNININGNTITSTDANGNIILTPNGTGSVVAESVYINGVQIGISADPDLLELKGNELEVNGDIEFGTGSDRNILVETAAATSNGNDLDVTAGTGGAGNTNGGDLVLDGGALAGTGEDGNVIIAQTNGLCEMGVLAFSVSGTDVSTAQTVANTVSRVRLSDGLGYNFGIADGQVDGQRMSIVMVSNSGNAAILNTNLAGTSITFNAVGETALLEFDRTSSLWYMIGGTATYTA